MPEKFPAPLKSIGTTDTEHLRSRLITHAKKVDKIEEMEAALAGVFNREAQGNQDRFGVLVKEVVKPRFDVFKAALREVGRDAVIISSLAPGTEQSIRLTLIDKYLSFGAGKTVKLVNPNRGIPEQTNTKFYEVYRSEELIFVRQRTDLQIGVITTQVTYADVIPKFLENELALFFERAYPTES